MEDTIVIDEAGRGFEEVEEDAVGLAAEEHEVEDLDERWEPHCAGLLFDDSETMRSRMKEDCEESLCLVLYSYACDDGDIRGYIPGMSQIDAAGSPTSTPCGDRKHSMPRSQTMGM